MSNVRYNQIKPGDRQGNGPKFVMAGSGTPLPGDIVYYDSSENMVPASREFNVKVFGAAGDGVIDDTAAGAGELMVTAIGSYSI